MISIVVAADKNRAIGAKNRIPWRLRDDLVSLKELTLNNTVILGRKSYDSMLYYYEKSGRPMPGKTYIVITRNPDYISSYRGVMVARSVEEALDIAKRLGEEIFVIGGGDIFKAFLPYVDRIYLTEVDARVAEADAYFPELVAEAWHESSREHHEKSERNEFDYDFVVLDRIK